ncbi:ABC transporter permease EcsB [Staphylococcus auricularis]|uniref:ABC transporter permease EcsB n=1 Tax=Staphylococcus auricularis TaxID=29379 RepID=UPI0024318037|nr:ABC transporter permease [Staphylococcus auricularis]
MSQEAKQLFNTRREEIRKEKQYYHKFIFNGHFSVFLVILLGAFILGYGNWLQSIPEGINYSLIASIIVALVSIFPIRTLLKEADQLFLLPFEKKMSTYMKQSLNYSYLNRLVLQIGILIVLFPLFYVLNDRHFVFYICFAILALILPYIGLLLRWEWYRYGLENWSINVVLFICFTSSYFSILQMKNIVAVAPVILLALLVLIIRHMNENKLFPWERMIKIEYQHHMNYYKFVNMFTDVKALQETAVRRRYLDVILTVPRSKHFNSNYMYLFLFVRSFVRGKDAFNIILRLVIIAVVLMIWLSQPIASLIIGSLFMYITLLQMAQFYTQQAYGLWPQVWPVPDTKVIKGYEQFLYRLMIVIGIIFALVFAIMSPQYFFGGILFFIVGWLTIHNVINKLKHQEMLLRD